MCRQGRNHVFRNTSTSARDPRLCTQYTWTGHSVAFFAIVLIVQRPDKFCDFTHTHTDIDILQLICTEREMLCMQLYTFWMYIHIDILKCISYIYIYVYTKCNLNIWYYIPSVIFLHRHIIPLHGSWIPLPVLIGAPNLLRNVFYIYLVIYDLWFRCNNSDNSQESARMGTTFDRASLFSIEHVTFS